VHIAALTSFLWRLHGGGRWRRQALTHQLEEQQEHQQATADCSRSGGGSFVPAHRRTTGDSAGSLTLVLVSVSVWVLVLVLIAQFAGAFALVHFGFALHFHKCPFISLDCTFSYVTRSFHMLYNLLKHYLNKKERKQTL